MQWRIAGRQQGAANILRTMATLGMLGTLVSLMQMLSTLRDAGLADRVAACPSP